MALQESGKGTSSPVHLPWGNFIYHDNKYPSGWERSQLPTPERFKDRPAQIRDFSRLDIRVGKVIDARPHWIAPDILHVMLVDIGEMVKRCTAGRLTEDYSLPELRGRRVLLLCNIWWGWARGADVMGVLMCAKDGDRLELLDPPEKTRLGDRVFVPGYAYPDDGDYIVCPNDPRNPQRSVMRQEHLGVFETVAEDLRVNSEGQAVYKDVPLRVEDMRYPATPTKRFVRAGLITAKTFRDCPITTPACDDVLYPGQQY